MSVHDWTLVDAGVFHAFHTVWVGNIQVALNDGRLPDGYYALAEQHAGAAIADVLTLDAGENGSPPPQPPPAVGTAVAEAPPRARGRKTVGLAAATRPRTVAVRHVTGHRLVALIEIVSPANKDRLRSVEAFATKAADALAADVHVLVADLLPPGRHDPFGMNAAVWQRLEDADEPAAEAGRPAGEPLTVASYDAGPPVEAYLEYLAAGAELPDMPLFLRPGRYVNVPLAPTYAAAYRGMPAFWRDVLEGRRPAGG